MNLSQKPRSVSQKFAAHLIHDHAIAEQHTLPAQELVAKAFDEYHAAIAQGNSVTEGTLAIGQQLFSDLQKHGIGESTAAIITSDTASYAHKYALIFSTPGIPQTEQFQALFYENTRLPGIGRYALPVLSAEIADIAASEKPKHEQSRNDQITRESFRETCAAIVDKIAQQARPRDAGARAELRHAVQTVCDAYAECFDQALANPPADRGVMHKIMSSRMFAKPIPVDEKAAGAHQAAIEELKKFLEPADALEAARALARQIGDAHRAAFSHSIRLQLEPGHESLGDREQRRRDAAKIGADAYRSH